MPVIQFEIKGDPKALKRHRSFRRGNFIGQYDPNIADKSNFLAIVQRKAPKPPIDSPIFLKAKFKFMRPKNHYRTNGEIKPKFLDAKPGKPDVDNLVKFIFDSLNKVFWRDDSLIYRVEAEKDYSETPGTAVSIYWF